MSLAIAPSAAPDQNRRSSPRCNVSIEQYARFRRDGFLVVPQLVAAEQIAELKQHTEDLMQGRLPEQKNLKAKRNESSNGAVLVDELGAPPEHLSPQEKANFFLRIHMLHRRLELHERYLLHPRVLDVLEVLIGPDVMALQTMLFLKPPGAAGQGWHQDSYYIPTSPDSLCGAWIAIDDCDEQNGAMWFAKGSGVEPVYPPCPEVGYGFGDQLIGDIRYVKGASNTNDAQNSLSRVADKYDQVLVSANAGDVVFFNGHVLHRSKQNWSSDRYRRSFVSHYSNARGFTQWAANIKPGMSPAEIAHAKDPVTGMTNGSHILARGDTHLPFAKTLFGTPCAADLPPELRGSEFQKIAAMIQATGDGMLGCAIADPTRVDDDDEETPASSGY